MSAKIYLVKLDSSVDENIYDFLMKFIQSEKKERILKNRVNQNAKQMILAEILAKTAIKKEYGIDIKNQEFVCSETGKPYLKNHSNIFFNISHSDEYVVCAVSGSEIGIDIQKIRDLNMNITGKVCNEKEIAFLEKCSDRNSEFIKLWTAKEAVLKLHGAGIARGDIKNCIGDEFIRSYRMGEYWISVASEN